ncbi:MAG: Z1 domain-containing protein [Acidobacteria bacterium]|nr:Z1 domain-containing protein [Acidobacteriota bacterium]
MPDTYERIKDFITSKLKARQSQLDDGDIGVEVQNTRKLIAEIGPDVFSRVLPDQSPLVDLSDSDWVRMERELESHFNVRMKDGILIRGAEQQTRDTTWWSNKVRIQAENFYWNRYEKYIKTKLPPDVVSTIDKDTDLVMNNIGDPSIGSFDIKGMVVGHVQSGKTGNYAGLVCKAADSGYKFIVVIAGGTNNLRNQTQHRLNEAFVGLDMGQQVGAGIGNSPPERMPICLTTTERDFNRTDADRNSQGLNFQIITVPVLIVIKKNTSALSNVITWLRNQYRNRIPDHSMLIIDDESDYASINTNDADKDPTQINKRIRELITMFNKGSYVAYTATPYANIFIDHEATSDALGDDLFPKDFIYALDAPTNYFGARRIFIESEDRHLIPIPEADLAFLPLRHKKDTLIAKLPESMYEAIRLFVINVAIRGIRGQGGSHNSMLIHASRFTLIHEQLTRLVEEYLKVLQKEFSTFGMLHEPERQSTHIAETQNTFESIVEPAGEGEDWPTVAKSITATISSLIVREVHQRSRIKLEYRSDIVTNAIAVGGASLSRGYTLEGLSVSYFMRNTVFYDTLMQMGRWFGYRPGYEDLCRIYMPEMTIDHFRTIIEATEDLIDSLKVMAENNRTPNEFGLAVRQHPDSALQITARNKQRNVHEFYFSMKLDGQLKETAYLSKDNKVRKHNLAAIERVLDALANHSIERVGNSYLWRDVNRNLVARFLDDYNVYSIDRLGITTRMPIEFVKKYVAEREILWDVALYSGKGRRFDRGTVNLNTEERKLDSKGSHYQVRNRQVSSGNAESIALDGDLRDKVGNDRRLARENLSKPLLMLHLLDTGADFLDAAFGISFPGNVLSTEETIKLKINTVYYQDLLNEMEPDDDETE